MKLFRLVAFSVLLLLGGCRQMAESRVAALIDLEASPSGGFDVCHGSGCKVRTRVALTSDQWAQVRSEFAATSDAVAERIAVREAIGLMERLVAEPAGTGRDRGENNYALDQSTQLDCVDESVNSTTYLRMIAKDGLLKFHDVEFPAHRGGVIQAHNTAVIRDTVSGKKYAVDSYFFANGVPAIVLPLDVWLSGWHPGDSEPDIGATAGASLPVVATCRCSGGIKPEILTVEP